MDFQDTGRSGPRYREYELEQIDRQSLASIASQLQTGYADPELLRAHLNFLEGLSARIQEIIQAEEAMGYSNDTLKVDFQKVVQLRKQLIEELRRQG